MFQFLKKQKTSPRLLSSFSIFGKLPGMADFIKINAHSEQAVEINEAVAHLWSELHEKSISLDREFSLQCVFEEKDHHVLIQMIHSRDKIGRCYPLTTFCHLKSEFMTLWQPAAPLITEPVVSFMKSLQEQDHLNSRSSLETACESSKHILFEQTKASLLESEVKLLKSCDQGTFIQTAYPDEKLEMIASSILNNASDILAFKEDQHKPLSFRLSKDHVLTSSVFWLQWIETLLQPKRWPLHYCIINTNHVAQLHVWFEKPLKLTMNDWIFMNQPLKKNLHKCERLEAVLMRKDITLCDALYLWKQEVLRCD